MYSIDNKHFLCTTSITMYFLGGKWKAAILTHLINKKRYNELRKELPMISERTLSLQLKELEFDGLISRNVFTEKPPLKVEYQMTDFGKTLIPLLEIIDTWGKTTVKTNNRINIIK